MHLRQRERFQVLLKQSQPPDFTHPQHYHLLMHGVPAEFRVYVWTQLLPNRADVQHPFYCSLQAELAAYKGAKGTPTVNAGQVTGIKGSNKLGLWLELIDRDVPRTLPELKLLSANREQA